MKASSAYTVANLRDPEFTKKNGVEASIMDYGRFNYVAQPGDGAALIPIVAPYDYFAVDWGYREYQNKEQEEKGLAALFAMQKEDATLRFGDADPSEDPTRQSEDLGSDSLEATRMGMLNINRVADYLIQACCKPGEDYDLLSNMYDRLLGQRTRELIHVTGMVGGFEQINLFYGDSDRMYQPISAKRQRKAVEFLLEQAFQTPQKLVDPNITARLEASGAADRILESQQSVLRSLLSTSRIKRMAEHLQRSKDPSKVYTTSQLLEDLRQGIMSELYEDEPVVDLYRRNLQRAHVELLSAQVISDSRDTDLPALARAELTKILESINGKDAIADALTEAHFRQLAAAIQEAFDTRVVQTTAAPSAAPSSSRRRAPVNTNDLKRGSLNDLPLAAAEVLADRGGPSLVSGPAALCSSCLRVVVVHALTRPSRTASPSLLRLAGTYLFCLPRRHKATKGTKFPQEPPPVGERLFFRCMNVCFL